jgi:flagellar assembly factor FliW
VKINTSRFGEIEVTESEWIVMKGSILGFEHLTRFVLLIHDNNTPLWWLQSIDDPETAFVVVNPRIVTPGYNPSLYDGDLEFLDIRNDEDIAILAIVTVRSHPVRITTNLRAPILINAANRMANQVILEDPDYPIQFDLMDNKAVFNQDLSEGCRDMRGLGKLSFTSAAI